jgi:hypothetical protein
VQKNPPPKKLAEIKKSDVQEKIAKIKARTAEMKAKTVMQKAKLDELKHNKVPVLSPRPLFSAP